MTSMHFVDAYLAKGQIAHEGKVAWQFSGTNYLGTAQDPTLQALYAEATARYGSYISTSRASNICFGIYEEADTYLASWLGVEAARVLSSGLVAGQLLLKLLDEAGLDIAYAPGVHPANWRSIDDANDAPIQPWIEEFVSRFCSNPNRPTALFYQAVDPLGLKPTNWNWLEKVPKDNALLLILDDSHLIGLSKDRGGGIESVLAQEPSLYSHVERITLGSLSKGMGIAAGYLAGSRLWMERLANSPFYVGASMPSAAAMHVLVHGHQERKRLSAQLQENIALFCRSLEAENALTAFAYLPAYPIFAWKKGQAKQLYEYLKAEDIHIAHFSYPNKEDPPLTRIVLHGSHETTAIKKLSQHIIDFLRLAC